MKKLITLFLLFISIIKFSDAQILCVQCFEQNDSIGVNVGANNLIVNGGFENTTCGIYPPYYSFCPNSNLYNCNISNWTCTGGGSSSFPCFFDNTTEYIVEGIKAPYFGNSTCRLCNGNGYDTSCLSSSGCSVLGIPAGRPISGVFYGDTLGINLFQIVTGLVPGNTYILEFWAGGYGSANITKGLFAVDVGFGNVFLRNKGSHPIQTGVGRRFLIQFKATSPSHTVKFTYWGMFTGVSAELILDDIRLYAPQYLPVSIPVCTSGITEPTENTIIISPNPATNELTVNTNDNEQSTVAIYDLLSRKVLEQTFTNMVTLNIESLSKGMYMYEVRNKNGVVKNGKVIKE